MSGNRSLDFEVRWKPVLARARIVIYISTEDFSASYNNYFEPSGYRWRVQPKSIDAPEAIYIGEAEDLSPRIQRVLTPSNAF